MLRKEEKNHNKANGKVAQGTGFYLNGSKTPVTVGTIG